MTNIRTQHAGGSLTWLDRAACRTDPDRMFPPLGDRHALSEAKAVCRTCPVIALCLRAALAEEGRASARNRYGVRGGCSPYARFRLYQQRASAQTTNQPKEPTR